ncbi:MAG: VWA domain-containing protein [Halanaerobiaceae bacterium]
MFRFLHWYFLFLIPVIIYLFLYKKNKKSLKFSSLKLLKDARKKTGIKHKIGKYLITLALILLCLALARPQLSERNLKINREGIDIALLVDVSGSMESVDFEPNRLEVARKTIDDFIQERVEDRLSLVIFAGNAYTKVPLTLDHSIVRKSLEEVDTDSVNQDGTAIGMGISVGLNRLKKSDAESRIMILVTDGENNTGGINPLTAVELAREMGVKIYTIGVGSDETIIPVNYFGQIRHQRVEGGIDEELLEKIAETTDGRYYRAMEADSLANIFAEINQLEKTSFEKDNFQQYTELAYIFIKLALFLLLAGVFFDRYYYIRIP